MPASWRLVGVGAFIVIGMALFVVGLFLIGERRMLFARTFEVYTEFAKIGGVQDGASVRVSGMKAGEVKEIQVPGGPNAKFRLRLEVREDLHPLVRADSVASIQTEGLVGGQFIQIGTGSERAPAAPAGSTIPSREPFEVADLLQQMRDTVKTVNDTVNELRDDIRKTVATVAETTQHADEIIENVSADIDAITKSSSRITADIRAISDGVRAGQGTVGKLFADDELYNRMAATARKVGETADNLRKVAEEAKQGLADLRSKNGPVRGMTSDVRQTLDGAREAIAGLAENMEALKHNFLFRGFFNRRGYFDLDRISPAEYRQGTLGGGTRETLHIWLDAAVLFSRDADGVERLAEEGKVRLDSAMASFLLYAGDSVLMIEGYAATGSRDQQFLESRARAAAVREYVIARFHLDPETTGLMPLGAEAKGSPKGDTWEGVALALFVDRARLRHEK